jgi:hypothetical protein
MDMSKAVSWATVGRALSEPPESEAMTTRVRSFFGCGVSCQ